jgi:hypothetical protein
MASDKKEDLTHEIWGAEYDLENYTSEYKECLTEFILEKTLPEQHFSKLVNEYYGRSTLEKVKRKEWELLQDIVDLKIKKMKQEIMEEMMKELHGPGGLSEKIGKIQFNKTCENRFYSKGSLDE